VNFGALYGIGAKALAQYAWDKFDVAFSRQEAAVYLRKLERAYPGLTRWRQAHYERCEARAAIVIGRDMANGNGRLYRKSHLPNGKSFFTRCCNLPVQGACADASMLALAAIDLALDHERIAGGPVAWLHDEIVIEVPAEDAQRAAELLSKAMTWAFLQIFPGAPLNGLVEPRIVTNWGEPEAMTVVSRIIEKRERRARREAELGERQRALPNKRYGVILADPPWRFEPYSRISGMDRAADNHYPTSALEEIKALAVASIAAPDCVLFLWATVPMLPQALEAMAAWGFAYKSSFAWAKNRMGTGYWNRNKHELLLVGTRGHVPAPAMGTQVASLIEAPVKRHSEKPAVFYEIIERYFPTLPQDRAARARHRCAAGMGCMGAGSAGHALVSGQGHASCP
jgi:N6-adenosine-specific RNA methylase IME4